MSDYKPTIGLEIHVELKTQTKMFCDSKNDPDEKRPNQNVCPVCMGHPGTLPTINKEAVKHVLRVGMAVGGTLADFTEFDRKNYFYPDIPKGYQISQFAYPLVKGGSVNGIELTRIHLEEDTARNQHEGSHSLVDFNRAGVPLMELVTEPVIHSAKEAGDFGREFQLLLRTLGVSDADMEKGHLRMEVNLSVSKDDTLGTKTEVKNINSFSYAEKAIEYEIARQIAVLEAGEEVVQETRGWDSVKNQTYSQRKKESSHDYRYFPEPDLPKLKISEIPEFSNEALKASLPELPQEKRARYMAMGLKEEDARMFSSGGIFGSFFESVLGIVGDNAGLVKLSTNYIAADLAGLVEADAPITLDPTDFADLMKMIDENLISSRGAKDILKMMVEKGGAPADIAEKEGLLQQSDEGALTTIVDQIIADNPKVVADYKGGKENLLQFFVGQGMKASKGSANPALLQELFKKALT
ncbi:MAG: aspartyl-tRNA(Asn)/glutamyl-tRNA(Gln) amidotransferase subunit, partial [Patescibacteria group bacterium]|jgi:aspartyl-tRNA(Asn)/glutamyl-tRNA(Gln) amidotransferase subunit B|nr:aspartyl-tRNA(Asn)/glutamyl-tRNA(Gln) amidotransferase subunit [Patescibacteria group bacterium]